MNKNTKKIKRIIILIMMFIAILLLLPKFENATNYSYRTINGKTITKNTVYNTNNNTYKYTHAKLLSALDNKANSYSNFPSINNNELEGLDNIKIGYKVTSNDGQSDECHVWNRAVGHDTGKDYRTTAFCYHATTSSEHTNLRSIRAIIIIDDGKIDFIHNNNIYNKSTDINDKNNNIYLQKMLANLYASQNDYEIAWDCANYYMYSDARIIWPSNIAKELWGNANDDNIKKIGIFNVPTSYGGYGGTLDNDYSWKQEDNNQYKYKGIFIFADTGDGQGTFYYRVVREKKVPNVQLTLNKQDFSGKALSNAEITIGKGSNVSNIDSTKLTIGSGTINVTPIDNTGEFTLIIKETKAPTGYSGMQREATLTVTYNTTTGAVTSISSSNTTNIPNTSSKNIIIKNKPKYNLTIKKIDSLTGEKLPNVRFKIELTNVDSIGNYQIPQTGAGETQNPPTVIYVKTDSNGEIKLKDIVPKNPNVNVTAKITELEVPNGNGYHYNLLENPVTVTLDKTAGSTTTETIKNQPLIDLSGMVWEDGQIGEKNVAGPNGKIDSGESGRAGVLVGLKRVSDNKIIKSVTTGEDGKYSFIGIPYLGENSGYQIVFSYDGINWQETKSIRNATDGDSDATEQDRTKFNNNFKTISKGLANDTTTLEYTSNNNVSELKVDMAGNTTGNTDAKFQMTAQTETYRITTSNIDCGLVKKEFDLALGTDVKSATLKINDKETTYNYAQIMNGEMEDLLLDDILQNNSSTSDVNYNLYLYTSDYNYRIEDYKTGDEAIKNAVNPDDNTVNNYENLKELEAYVTYTTILKGQTTYTATVNEFVYYYDSVYTPYKIDGKEVKPEQQEYEGDNYNFKIEPNKITFTSKENTPKIEKDDYRVEVDLTFKVNKNTDGNIIMKNNVTNVAEITKYSTAEGGLIDKDSAPDNANVTFENGTPKVGRYEDDTDKAKGINISVKEDKIRTITGTVFEDLNKDGALNDNKPVNDVIVQLIEIKKISGKYYEYIWQETRSGSNQVKTTARNGYPGEKYTNGVEQGSGMYEFKDYIPGNYIIRYIYGDGSTYDVTDNVKTYNGQDYKSTIDANYNKAWYNTAGYTNGQSVARDNEARRLEVMAYSSTIDQTIGQSLENRTKDDLKNTWMCAETSRINVPVDADNKATDANSTIASYDYTKNNKKVEFGNINFGLALRPETKIILEKHITGLKITPNGTGVQPIVDATADIEQIINGTTVDTKGVTSGLATIKSERNERGFWKVETDIEELAQGAQLEVEYTYVIRNESDEDYLSSDLVEAYKSKDIKEYSETLGEIKKAVKDTMRSGIYSYSDNNQIGNYLGQYYYNGNSEGCAEVLSRVEKLEEAVNNQLKYDETISGEDFKKANTEAVPKNTYDTDGNLVDNVTNGTKNIETVVETTSASDFLAKSKLDYSKTLKLTTVLTSFNNGEGYYPSYIAEITKYSNAAGRRNMEAEPANLSYVHSEDTRKTIETDNEVDEFWGEQIIISKPTGFNKQLAIQITIVTISSIAVIGVGIVLIKKFVLKK